MRKNVLSINFESYASRILSLNEYENLAKKNPEKKTQKRFQIKNGVMKMMSIKKYQFTKLSHKRFYFFDGIVPFPFGHSFLSEIRDCKRKAGEKMQKIFLEKIFEMLKIDVDAISRNERLRLFRSILPQPFRYYKIDSNKRPLRSNFSKRDYTSRKDHILNSYWL